MASAEWISEIQTTPHPPEHEAKLLMGRLRPRGCGCLRPGQGVENQAPPVSMLWEATMGIW